MANAFRSNARLRVKPTVSASAAYTSGDIIGSVMQFQGAFTNERNGILRTVTLKDADNEKAAISLILFDQAPTGSYVDNAAFSWGAGDFEKCIGIVPLATAGYVTVGSEAVVDVEVNRVVQDATPGVLPQGTGPSIWALMVTTSTPTYTTTGSVEVQLGVQQG